MLHHRRLPASQITDGAVTDPTGRQFDVGRLGTAELTSRSLDVGAVLLGRRADIPGIPELPAQRLQARPPLLVDMSEADRELEGDGGVTRELGVLQEPGPFVVTETLAAEAHGPAPPVSQGRVRGAGLRRG